MVTSTIAWEGDPQFGGRPGLWREYEGGIEDWLTQRERSRASCRRRQSPRALPVGRSAAPRRSTKLSYKEQRELDALPARIEALEAEQKQIGGTDRRSRAVRQRSAARRGAARTLRRRSRTS